MTIKTFEVRDRGTFTVVLAIRLDTSIADQATPAGHRKEWLLMSAGFGQDTDAQRQYVLLLPITGGAGEFNCDPYKWMDHGTRTFHVAHQHILANFGTLEDGAVVCVEHILGERPEPKPTEMRHWPL